MAGWNKLGLIAGGGALPVQIAEHCAATGQAYFVARIEGLSDPALDRHPGASFGLGEMGARFKAMKSAGVDAVALAGIVKRPDFRTLRLDGYATLMLPRILAAARKGDDALLRVLVEACEKEGFRVIGAEAVMGPLRAGAGVLGRYGPDEAARADMAKGAEIAAALGAYDIGQGCVVCDGLVLALEAQEGTDAMIARVATLPPEIRGSEAARKGVLVKRAKPGQERRIDLPTIGVPTIDGAARAGLAGIAVEADGALIVGADAVLARADALGLFVYGFTPDDLKS